MNGEFWGTGSEEGVGVEGFAFLLKKKGGGRVYLNYR